MNGKHRMALGVAPMFLRLGVALIFVWAGLVKLMGTMEVSGETAATLANMGAITPAPSGPATTPATPTKPLPAPPEVKPGEPAKTPAGDGTAGRVDGALGTGHVVLAGFAVQDAGESGAPKYSAADFPTPVKVSQVYGVALAIHGAAHPAALGDGPAPKAIWPAALAEGRMPVVLAYAVAITELLAGGLVLIGLMTRLSAFSLAGVMVGAAWLTQFGPAVQAGDGFMGVLPNHAALDMASWTPLLFQVLLLMACLALVFTGPGYMAADHLLFGGRRTREDHDGE